MGKQPVLQDWLYRDVGERMFGWVKHGATIEIAADLAGVSESRLASWFELAARFPNSPMAALIRDLQEAAHVTGNGHSSTGSIVGGGHGRKDDQPSLISWRDL
jgi:hypothetical protein